jgi:hypothetical protein
MTEATNPKPFEFLSAGKSVVATDWIVVTIGNMSGLLLAKRLAYAIELPTTIVLLK